MVTYRDNGHLTVEERYFNWMLSRARFLVERSIGFLKNRWRILWDRMPNKRLDLIPFYIVVCCILHNNCLRAVETFEYPVIVPNNLDLNPVPRPVSRMERQLGIEKRNEIKHRLNNE